MAHKNSGKNMAAIGGIDRNAFKASFVESYP